MSDLMARIVCRGKTKRRGWRRGSVQSNRVQRADRAYPGGTAPTISSTNPWQFRVRRKERPAVTFPSLLTSSATTELGAIPLVACMPLFYSTAPAHKGPKPTGKDASAASFVDLETRPRSEDRKSVV